MLPHRRAIVRPALVVYAEPNEAGMKLRRCVCVCFYIVSLPE